MPFFLGQYLVERRGWSRRRGLWLVALSLFLAQLIGVGQRVDPFSLTVASRLVENGAVTSYFTDAVAFLSQTDRSLAQWLADFPAFVARLTMHSKTKPPGGILFYVALARLFGTGAGASTVGALLIALIASAGAFAVDALVRTLSDGDEALAFASASAFALFPGLVIIHPMFDQILPVLTCALVGLWALALKDGRGRTALLCGLVTALALFFSYSFVSLGVFLLG